MAATTIQPPQPQPIIPPTTQQPSPTQQQQSQQQQQQVLFTVEQIELVRRLRNSGITKEQIVLAFDSLDRLDRELGPVYSIPISQAFTQQLFARQVLAAAAAAAPVVQPPPLQVPSTPTTPQKLVQVNGSSGAPPPPPPQSPRVTTPNKIEPQNAVELKQEKMEEKAIVPSSPNGDAVNGLMSVGDLILNPVEEIKDDNPEFMCFAAQGEPACCDQIRAFVSKYNIRQQQIATLSRISQSYVSRFLKGDFFDMSERSRRAIKKWYIAYRNNPATIAMAVNLVLLSHGAQNGSSPSSTSSSSSLPQSAPKMTISDLTSSATTTQHSTSDFLNQRRRERFVFRPNHLEILEKNFQEDSYPSFEKREEMARACNAATESLTGRPLGDKEVVTAQIVSNWFANKRKEMKKLAREEGLDLSQVPLRPRGRPCRFFGDLMAQIQEGQNSRDSASEMEVVINGHLQEAQMLMKENASAVPAPAPRQEEVVTVIPRAPEETAEEEAAAAAAAAAVMNGAVDMSVPAGGAAGGAAADERALSLSVELAAVNQAILSLTGQQPLGSHTPVATSTDNKDNKSS